MIDDLYTASSHTKSPIGRQGYSLVELLIAIVITALVGGAIATNYIVQQRAATKVRQMAYIQQQIRGVFYIMAEDIRLAGYNRIPEAPDSQRNFGILDIQSYDIPDNDDSLTAQTGGSPILQLAYDYNRLRPNSQANSNYAPRCAGAPAEPTTGNGQPDEPYYAYLLFDEGGDGITELGRRVYDDICGDTTEILAENIEAVGFAYAFDNDGDNLLDVIPGTTHPFWAVDTNNDNTLDTNLDVNMDGLINIDDADSESTDPVIGTPLPGGVQISVDKIRAVRIWLLAGSGKDPRYEDTNTYVVGNHIIDMTDTANHTRHAPNRRRLLVDHVLDCRNMFPADRML